MRNVFAAIIVIITFPVSLNLPDEQKVFAALLIAIFIVLHCISTRMGEALEVLQSINAKLQEK